MFRPKIDLHVELKYVDHMVHTATNFMTCLFAEYRVSNTVIYDDKSCRIITHFAIVQMNQFA